MTRCKWPIEPNLIIEMHGPVKLNEEHAYVEYTFLLGTICESHDHNHNKSQLPN